MNHQCTLFAVFIQYERYAILGGAFSHWNYKDLDLFYILCIFWMTQRNQKERNYDAILEKALWRYAFIVSFYYAFAAFVMQNKCYAHCFELLPIFFDTLWYIRHRAMQYIDLCKWLWLFIMLSLDWDTRPASGILEAFVSINLNY